MRHCELLIENYLLTLTAGSLIPESCGYLAVKEGLDPFKRQFSIIDALIYDSMENCYNIQYGQNMKIAPIFFHVLLFNITIDGKNYML